MKESNSGDEKVHLSQTEEQLMADKGGEYRDSLMQSLYAEAIRLKSMNDKGASPEEFARVESILTGVVAAIEVIEKSWNKHHKKGQ